MMFPYLDFFQMIHSMAAYYNKADGFKAFKCVFISICEMIPSGDPFRTLIYEAEQKFPLDEMALENSRSLLMWSYKINSYVHRQYYGSNYLTYDKFKEKYDAKNMTMGVWSHPTWKLIHYLGANYDQSNEYALSYKAFISCLQFLLPCPKCKKHLRDNLADHPIDEYFSSAKELFKWGYILHQAVSGQTNKAGISFDEAMRLYNVK